MYSVCSLVWHRREEQITGNFASQIFKKIPSLSSYFKSCCSHSLLSLSLHFLKCISVIPKLYFWVELQCKRKRWKEQSPQPFPDCLCFLNVYSTVNFHLPAPLFFLSFLFRNLLFIFRNLLFFLLFIFRNLFVFLAFFYKSRWDLFFQFPISILSPPLVIVPIQI